jgi:glycogen synthase
MRILLTADTVGGVWDYAATLTGGLTAAGHEVLLASLGEPGEAARAALHPAVRVEWADHRLEWLTRDEAEIRAAAEWLRALAAAWGAELVHLNQMAYTATPFPVATVVVAHSDVLSWFSEVRGTAAPEEWAPYAGWVRAGLRGAGTVVAPSAYQSQLLARHFGRGADRVIHNGSLAPARLPTAAREELVLSAGRAWDEAKGIVTLDRALELLGGEAPPAEHFGATRGPSGERFEPRALTCHGLAPRSTLEARMESAALFVAPSLYEPFGLAPLEAAQRGCALVLSDIGSFRELWDGCAGFFPAGDARALAGTLRALRRDPIRRRELAAAAYRRATTRYAAERFAREYLNLYATPQPRPAPSCA